MASNLYETEYLIDLVKKNNGCLYTDYIYTNSKSINYIKENLSDIGDLISIEGEIKQFGKFYTDSVDQVIGVHLISAILYILGNPTNVSLLEYIPLRVQNNIVLESRFKLNIPNIKHTSFSVSLVSGERSRKIVIEGNKGKLAFNMLADNTVSKYIYNELNNGYEIVNTEYQSYDEQNNLSIAIDSFYKYIMCNALGNIVLAQDVAKILNQINCMRL